MQQYPQNHMYYCIQCKDITTGDTGCFAYDTDYYEEHNKFKAISPNFDCVFSFYRWAHDQGFLLHDKTKGPFVMINSKITKG